MKIRVTKKTETGDKKEETVATRKVAPYDPSKYSSFGTESQNAYNEGWLPQEALSATKRVYINPYDNALSQVVIPGDKRLGHMALIGNDNGFFDVAIRNADGKVMTLAAQQVPYATAKQYIANQVGNRVNNIQKGVVASTAGNAALLNK